jgi:polyhydroxyalkanoate synthesis regulator phasin
MAKDSDTVSEDPKGKEGKEYRPFFEISRKILLASVGAVAVAQEELEDFVDRLIDRGEIAEKDGRKLLTEMREKRKERSQKVEAEMSKKVRETLERMNVPTRADFEKLSASISSLSQKIDELAKSRK